MKLLIMQCSYLSMSTIGYYYILVQSNSHPHISPQLYNSFNSCLLCCSVVQLMRSTQKTLGL